MWAKKERGKWEYLMLHIRELGGKKASKTAELKLVG